MLMVWSKSVNRTTNVKIDDSEWLRIEYDYADDDQFSEHYWTGPQIELTAGEHTPAPETAPQTPDVTVLCLVSAAVSGMAAAFSKKKH